jgi:HK97 family phage major capsid protein
MPTLKEAQETVKKLSLDALKVVQATDMTPSEQKAAVDKIEADLKTAQQDVADLQHVEEKRKQFLGVTTEELGARSEEQGRQNLKSIGTQFVESDGYKNLIKSGLKGNWSTGQIEIKTTLSEGTVASPGPGNSPVAIPTLLPGIVDIRFQPLVVADLFAQGTTETPLIRYLVETVATNAAAATSEGAAYPESALAFDKVDEPLKKIATFLPITDEMLEDWGQAQSYIDGRLKLFVSLTEQGELLTGSGTDPHLKGLLNRSGLATAIPQAGNGGSIPASDNAMDAIYRQITQIRITSFLEPDSVVIDPVGWEDILLSKNSQGFYYAQGPFASAQDPMLWGKKVVATPAMPATTAVVGAFKQAAQLFRKGGITVEASNSHVDFFQKGLVAIRAEERLALAVYRPGAFGEVTGLTLEG